MSTQAKSIDQSKAVNNAFSKQSSTYDAEDVGNIVIQDLRKQVYTHVGNFLKPGSRILELNAGTGIDALHFNRLGHPVHATDLSDGMIAQLKQKALGCNDFSVQQVSYDSLDQINQPKFDYVFSNFGGLNCIPDLKVVIDKLPLLLNPGAYVTWVVMPKVCPWELMSALKANFGSATRRFRKGGVVAQIDGEFFQTYYFSLVQIKGWFSQQYFSFIKSEGLAALSPPPHRADIPLRKNRTYKILRGIDASVRNHYPFNRWADHIIVTFQFNPR